MCLWAVHFETPSPEFLAVQFARELIMNWEQIQGQAKQVGGKFKTQWAALTDDDLLLLKGKKEIFLGKLQERTGLKKEEAEKQFHSFIETINP